LVFEPPRSHRSSASADHEDPDAVAELVAAVERDGTTDTDGSRPDCWGYLAVYGWERDDGAGIQNFR
jgi:hypothetical protein